MTPDDLIQFYVGLLIIQYVIKSNARATIANLVKDVVADMIYGQVQDAFDIETAIGNQLDVLGEYIGVPRYFFGIDTTKNYWADLEYGSLTDPNFGWSDYSDLTVGGEFLTYPDLQTPHGTLNDNDYRNLLKYQAVNRSQEQTLENIDNLLFLYFDTAFYITDNQDMSVTYTFKYVSDPVGEKSVLLRAIIEQGRLPRPAGVSLTLVDVMI